MPASRRAVTLQSRPFAPELSADLRRAASRRIALFQAYLLFGGTILCIGALRELVAPGQPQAAAGEHALLWISAVYGMALLGLAVHLGTRRRSAAFLAIVLAVAELAVSLLAGNRLGLTEWLGASFLLALTAWVWDDLSA